MENGLRTQARQVLLSQVASAYQRALDPHKQEILQLDLTRLWGSPALVVLSSCIWENVLRGIG